ncbi:MAG: ATP-binding cassette domain-containing protein [candidate division NC10 bacterium]
MTDFILEMSGITKEFPGVVALSGVDIRVRRGEIHALVGENGAGKSTLMKILSGVYPAGSFSGEIRISGMACRFRNIRESEKSGITIIYQELSLVKDMNITENILLGSEVHRMGILRHEEARRKAEEALKQVELALNPDQLVRYLGVGEQQLVEIAKALSKNAAILILDEPTAALSEGEADKLLAILRTLQQQGVTCIYISHRLKEVLQIADRVTVLRDGKTVCTLEKEGLDEETLITHMVGRELIRNFPGRKMKPGPVILEVQNWNVYDEETRRSLADVTFSLRTGEILGIAGLVGAGRTELVMSLFGAWGEKKSGRALLHGKNLARRFPGDAIKAGISLASEDRKRYGLVLIQDVKSNISLASLAKVSRHGVLDAGEEVRYARKYTEDLSIKTPSIEQIVVNLSGGNQQKIVLAKWLMTAPSVLILDEPTRGIDVGAKHELHMIINDLADQGVGIIMISSDLPELLGLCDRILVMQEGRITGGLDGSEATQENIMRLATCPLN